MNVSFWYGVEGLGFFGDGLVLWVACCGVCRSWLWGRGRFCFGVSVLILSRVWGRVVVRMRFWSGFRLLCGVVLVGIWGAVGFEVEVVQCGVGFD